MKKDVRRVAMLVLMLVLLISHTGRAIASAGEPDYTVYNYHALINALDEAKAGDVIGIMTTITVSSPDELAFGKGDLSARVTLKRMSSDAQIIFTDGGTGGCMVEKIRFDGNSAEAASSNKAFVKVEGKVNFEKCDFVKSVNHNGAGGALLVDYEAEAYLNNCSFSNNSASNGAQIWSNGTVRLTYCTLSGGKSTNQGGGIYNGGTLTITGSEIRDGMAKYGAGLYNIGSVEINNSLIWNNSADIQGNDIVNKGTLTDNTTDDEYSSWLEGYELYYTGWEDDRPSSGSGDCLKLSYSYDEPTPEPSTSPDPTPTPDPEEGGESGGSENDDPTNPDPTDPPKTEEGDNEGSDSGDTGEPSELDPSTPPTGDEGDPKDPEIGDNTSGENPPEDGDTNEGQDPTPSPTPDSGNDEPSTGGEDIGGSSDPDPTPPPSEDNDNEQGGSSGGSTDKPDTGEDQTSTETPTPTPDPSPSPSQSPPSSNVSHTDNSSSRSESTKTENSNNSTTYNYYQTVEDKGTVEAAVAPQSGSQPVTVNVTVPEAEQAQRTAQEPSQVVQTPPAQTGANQNIRIDAEGVDLVYEYTENGVSISISSNKGSESPPEAANEPMMVNTSTTLSDTPTEANKSSVSWVEYATLILLAVLVFGELRDKFKKNA